MINITFDKSLSDLLDKEFSLMDGDYMTLRQHLIDLFASTFSTYPSQVDIYLQPDIVKIYLHSYEMAVNSKLHLIRETIPAKQYNIYYSIILLDDSPLFDFLRIKYYLEVGILSKLELSGVI